MEWVVSGCIKSADRGTIRCADVWSWLVGYVCIRSRRTHPTGQARGATPDLITWPNNSSHHHHHHHHCHRCIQSQKQQRPKRRRRWRTGIGWGSCAKRSARSTPAPSSTAWSAINTRRGGAGRRSGIGTCAVIGSRSGRLFNKRRRRRQRGSRLGRNEISWVVFVCMYMTL